MPTSPRTRRLAALAAGAAALPLVLGACSSSSTSATTTTRATGHQGTTSVCTVVTPIQIRQQLGMAVKSPGVANATVTTICTYPSTDPKKEYESVIIGFRANVTTTVAGEEQAQVQKKYGVTTDVSGSGVQAYYYSATTGGHTVTSLVSLVGTTQVSVTSTASLARIEALSQQIFDTFASEASSTTTTAPAASTTTAP